MQGRTFNRTVDFLMPNAKLEPIMSIRKADGIVIRTRPFRETGKMVTLLSPTLGKITMIAQGARNVKSKFAGNLELFSQITVVYYERTTRDIQYISDIHMVNPFFAIRDDLGRTYTALTLVEICDHVTHANEDSSALYRLLLSTLSELNTASKNHANGLLYFLLSVGHCLGFRMDFSDCGHGGRRFFFNPDFGRLSCNACPATLQGGDDVSPEGAAAIRMLLNGASRGLYNLTLASRTRQEIYLLSMRHLQHHIDELRHLKTTRYLCI